MGEGSSRARRGTPVDPEKHHRRSVRLKDWNYSTPWWYYVTVCTHDRKCVLGKVVNDCVVLSESGRIAEDLWRRIPEHFAHVELDPMVVMPNHVHGIIILNEPRRGGVTSPLRRTPPTLGQVVAYFKYQSTKAINAKRGTPGEKFWQRSYYDHIIRDNADLFRIRKYISSNPLRWSVDEQNPRNLGR